MSPADIARTLEDQWRAWPVEPVRLRAYLVADGALQPEVRHALTNLPSRHILPRRLHARPNQYGALPWVAELPLDDGVRLSYHLLRTATWAVESDAASWLLSSLNLDDLTAALALRTEAQFDDGMRAVLRLADTRVLPEVHRVLNPDQAQAFFGFARAWWYVDRRGELRQLELERAATPSSPAGAGWSFDERQHAALLDAAEPDAVIGLLRRHDPEAIQTLPRTRQYDYIRRNIEIARGWKIEATQDQFLYCMLALNLGEDFYDRTPWKQALVDVRDGRIDMRQAVEQQARDR